MHTLPLSRARAAAKSAERLDGQLYSRQNPRRFHLQRFRLLRLIRFADLSALSHEEVARAFFCRDEESVTRLFASLCRISERQYRREKISNQRYRAIMDWQQTLSPAALGEILSPYHAPLSEKPFYKLSDAPTRRRLRKNAARFAAYHRLSPESAALLWTGELPRPPYLLALLPLLALPAALASGGLFCALLPASHRPSGLLILPALIGGFYLLAVALLQKLLPSSPLPLLRSGEGHSLLVVGIASAKQPLAALEKLARMISAGSCDCRYQLLLIPADAPSREETGEETSLAAVRAKAAELASRFDCAVKVTKAQRQYDPAQKRWRGTPTVQQLASLVTESIDTADKDDLPEAVCLLPVDAELLPDSFERLSAALFHPLCPADSLVFLHAPFSAHPAARLQTLRSCLLQKMNAPADFQGYGILRFEALQALAAHDPADQAFPLSPRLSGEALSLSSDEAEENRPPRFPTLRQTPSLLPQLPLTLAILRPLLLVWMILSNTPLRLFLPLALLSSADLWVSALLSFSPSPKRFCLSTLPAWKALGKELCARLLLPLREVWQLHPFGGKREFCISSLLFGALVCATEFLPIDTPLFFLGLIWAIIPLVISEPSNRQALTAKQKSACFALAEEICPQLLEHPSLPPAYRTLSGEDAPYTTPSVLGSELVALLSTLDLGLLDARTAEKKIAARLTKLEALPTRCGLPYARYAIDTEDFYKDSRIDSAECGIYALCLAALESGLRRSNASSPSFAALADRAARLSDRMELSLLLTEDDQLCRSLTPSGEQEGRLTHLFGMGGITLFAVLSSDSTLSMSSLRKRQAFSSLCTPITIGRHGLLIASEQGELWEYLLPNLLLPLSDECLLAVGAKRALRLCLREARRSALHARRADHRSAASAPPDNAASGHIFHRLADWMPLGKGVILPQTGSRRLGQSASPLPLTAPLLCLMLEQKPRIALCGLQKLQQSAPMGGFTDQAFEDRIPTAGLAFSLIALAGAITSRGFREQLRALPRCGAFLPLLDRRTEEWQTGTSPHSPRAEEQTAHTPPSVYLLGDAAHGLLLQKDGRLALWEGGKPLTAEQAADPLLSHNRITALLLSDGKQLLRFPDHPARRSPYKLCLAGEAFSCEILQSSDGWCLQLSRATASPIELRLLLSPACRKGKPIRLSTIRPQNARLGQTSLQDSPSDCSIALSAELSSSLTLAVGLWGVDSPFTHADLSPFPQGEKPLSALFSLPPKEAGGFYSAPSCIIGGIWSGQSLTIRFTAASRPSAAIEKLRAPAGKVASQGTPFPLPVPDHSLAAMVMEWELRALYSEQAIPRATAIGNAHLARCLDSARQILAEKGFPVSPSLPTPLSVRNKEGAEALLCRLLEAKPPCLQTPLLPPAGEIAYPDGFAQILRGRDLPSLSRIYHNGIATLWADPEALRFAPTLTSEPIPIRFLLTRQGESLLLPAAATVLSYRAGQAIFSGDGFTLSLSLLPKLPLLSVSLTCAEEAKLVFPTLSAPHKEDGEDRLWYLSETQVFYSRRLYAEGKQLLLIGSFPRTHDHLYYWIKEKITAKTLPALTERTAAEQTAAASVLIGITPDLPALPALAATVLEGVDQSKALLSPICTPAKAKSDLLRLATDTQSLLLPAALLLYCAVTGDERIADMPIPTADGVESLYLHSARSLEFAMERAPENPLLPRLTAAFAKLASARCDPAASLYEAFAPPDTASYPANGFDPLWRCPRKTICLLAALDRLDTGAVSALLQAIKDLPISPPAAESALLWCGVLFGVLGFHPAPSGCTFSPIAAKDARQFRFSYQGEQIIRLFPHSAPRAASAKSHRAAQKEENISRLPIFSRQNS